MDDERESLSWQAFGQASRELAQAIADDGFEPDLIRSSPRIGIRKAVEHPLRFVIEGNAFVSG